MKKTSVRRALGFLLALAMLLPICPGVFRAQAAEPVSPPPGKIVVTQTDYTIAGGVSETQVIMNNAAGDAQTFGYLVTVAPDAQVKLKASYKGYYTPGSTPESRAAKAESLRWDLRTTTGQAADYEAATGEKVVAATNGDYYNMQTGQACGYLIMEGNLVQQSNGRAEEPYFAVLRDGTYAIRDYGTPHDDVAEAISGPFYLLKNGEISDQIPRDAKRVLAPRNSIGLRADGTVVTCLIDGRAGVSVGTTCTEVAQILKAQGCVDAIYLDGGGSATFASRHEGASDLTIQNHPSDGPERVVASALLMVSTGKETGIFDHAALSPQNELYLPGAEIQFLAQGVDEAGFPANIPSDAVWKLEDPSFGTIDTAGRFRSGGKCGEVKVSLMQGDKVCGAASVQIREPAEVSFAADSLNLAFRKTSDLGLTLKFENRVMKTGGVSLDWKVESLTEGFSGQEMGSVTDNLFTAGKAKVPLNARVTVSYERQDGTVLTDSILLEIGRMPKVFWDFEPDGQGELFQVANHDWGDAAYSPEGFTPRNGPVTFTAWDDSIGGVGEKTETGPFFFDGGFVDGPTDQTRYPSGPIFRADGYDFMCRHASWMPAYGSNAQVVSAQEGQVRFGEYAMRWDYDYSELKPGYRNVNMWLNNLERVEFDGTPTGLGFWVYAPEGTPNYWLWLKVFYYDDNGNLKGSYVHLKTQEGRSIQYNGIYWDGWMYVEADLTPFSRYVTPERPLCIGGDGQIFLNITFIPGGSANENGDKIPMGDFAKGSIYLDNFRLVYGDTVDDMDSPVITGLTANGQNLTDDTEVLTENAIQIAASFRDPEGENATGIDVSKTALYIDGVRQELTASGETEAGAAVTLPNGTHSLILSVADGFGNLTKLTRYIQVKSTENLLETGIFGAETGVLGETYSLTLEARNTALVTEARAVLRLTEGFGIPEVHFPTEVTGSFTYEEGVLTIETAGTVPADGILASVDFQIDPATPRGTVLSYQVTEGSFLQDSKTMTFASEPRTVGLTAAYEISADVMVEGGSGKIYVTGTDGSAPGRVKVYAVSPEGPVLLGTTNPGGVLVTNRLCRMAGESFIIYAEGERGWSFRLGIVTNALGSDEVLPFNVRLNAVETPTTTQSITWFSAPEYTARKAVVQYAEGGLTRGSGEAMHTAAGTSRLTAFQGGAEDNHAVLLNCVRLEGLEPGTTYHYRVGDGLEGHWSPMRQFTTMEENAYPSFFVMGDTQLNGDEPETDPAILAFRQITQQPRLTDVDFGLQVGDFVDTANSLSRWNQILGLFAEGFPSLPFVQVMGNHEYYGDISGSLGNAIFDLPGKDYYSVEYGNLYIAVINCNANIEEAARWLAEDGAKTACPWRILTLHQPPYYTNPKGSSAPYHEGIPWAAEAAGIDFVFSGHDHTYARTEPVFQGEVREDGGVVYMICGDLGGKSGSTEYTPDNNPDFHFAVIEQDYDGVYVLAETTPTQMTVTACDADGTVLDTYTKKLTRKLEYIYDRETDSLQCTVSGQEPPTAYTGWAKDMVSGKDMYFLGGKYVTGWLTLGSDLYHFDSQTGEAHSLEVLVDCPTTCEEQGYRTVKCQCGETKTLYYEKPSGHVNEKHVDEEGNVTYVCTKCGRVSKYDLTFTDVADEDWFAPSVDYVVQNGLFRGKSTRLFDPVSQMTRAQLVTVLWRMEGSPDFDNVQSTPFVDCSTNTWYTAAVNWAAKEKIVQGVGENRFNPRGRITREQAVTILFRYAEHAGLDTTPRADLEENFTDTAHLSDYAREPMSWAVAAGIIQGHDGKLMPLNGASRAHVATMLANYHRMLPDSGENPQKP